MSVKRVVDFSKYLTAQSMAATVTGASTNVLYTDRVAYQINWTGSAVGIFTVEGSNDEVVWTNLPLSTSVTADNAADDAVIEVETALKFVRLLYTRTSGTGTLNAYITAKAISG